MIEVPNAIQQMAKLKPTLGIFRIEYDGAMISLQGFVGIVQKGQCAEVPQGFGGFLNIRYPPCYNGLENTFCSISIVLLQLGECGLNPWGGIRLLPLRGQCGHCVPQRFELILIGLFPLLEVSQLLPVWLGKLFDESIDVHSRPAADGNRCGTTGDD
jgi:hypothetical protein